MTGRVLIVDDEAPMCELLATGLGRRGFAVDWRTRGHEGLAVVADADLDAVVVDVNMPGMNGIEFCSRAADVRPEVPVLVVTAFGSLESAIAAIRAGAFDFLTKPFEIEQLALALERAVQHRRLRDEVCRLRRAVVESRGFDEIIGESPAIREVCDLIDAVASSDSTVLITGESGTGKELVARAVHARGRRADHPFVAVNCAAMAETLLESELFGHVRGAFTDAKESRAGLLVRAKGGTIFLDEVGDMSLGMQAKLLRALETRRVRPVGSDTEVSIETRIVAATNRDLDTDVDEGRFRRDLYFRINVIRIGVPALRARDNDIVLLAQRFVEMFAARAGKQVHGLSSAAAERLLAYPWPGNVRELQNAMEHAVAMTTFDRLSVADLPERVREHRRSHFLVPSDDPSQLLPMYEVERRYILKVLEATGGNKTLAAQVLGFDRRTMYRKLGRYAEDK